MNPYTPPTGPEPPNHGRTTGTSLRFLIWLMPTMMVSALAVPFLFIGVGNIELFSLIGSLIAIGGTIGFGYYDAKLKRQQKHQTKDQTDGDGWHAGKFFFLQLLIIPALLGVLAFALCGIIFKFKGL